MLFVQRNRTLSLLLVGIAVFSGASCSTSSENAVAPDGLVVVNATKAGTVKRILVNEETDVKADTVLIEIAVPSVSTIPSANANRPQIQNETQNSGKAMSIAEDDLQRASVELQRIEPLVASNNAPQAHLDAARAQYQQAQERVDQLRRSAQNPLPSIALQQSNNIPAQSSQPAENIVAVRAPVAGNVRVISVRVGQQIKAQQPIATISTTH
jgi:biotin carboxyl carrier protein